jgi:hypothetical protein
MTDNTDEESSDNPAIIQSESFSPKDTTPVDTFNPKPEIEKMDVHRHSQIERKSFKEYFLKFC